MKVPEPSCVGTVRLAPLKVPPLSACTKVEARLLPEADGFSDEGCVD